MTGEVRRQERSYRRGLIMGLTMAEVMLLVVFCLLLLLAWSWTREERPNGLAEALQQLERASGKRVTAPIPEDFLVLVKAGRAAVNVLNIQDSKLSEESAKEVEESVRLGLAARTAFGPNKMNQRPQDAAMEFIRESGQAYRVSNEEEPVGSATIWFQSLQKCAAECGGRGGDYPPCARTADGKPALIFTATLRSDSIELHDNRIPELEVARANWPLTNIRFDQPFPDDQFLAQTLEMFQWSEERACRFFVQISDETGSTEKMAYKNRLRTVEQHFYKHEPLLRR